MNFDRQQLKELGESLNQADPTKRMALLEKIRLDRDMADLSAKVDKIEKGQDKGWW